MATDAALQDPLLSLRRAIASGNLPTPTTSSELSDQHATEDLAKATHLYFSQPVPQTIPLSTVTRFISEATQSAVDLRSILFAWQNKDVAIPEYIASAEKFNEELKQHTQEGEKEQSVQILVFVERLDLITWLEGAAEEIDHIKPLEGAAAAAEAAAAAAGVAQAENAAGIAAGATGGVASAPSGTTGAAQTGAQSGRPQKQIDPRLQEIYNGERKTGDRNTVLRGIKPTVSFTTQRDRVTKLTRLQLGLFARPQERRAIPRPQPQPSRPAGRQTRQQERCARALGRTFDAIITQVQLTLSTRPYHSDLALRILSHPHVERQNIPRKGHLRPTRPPHSLQRNGRQSREA